MNEKIMKAEYIKPVTVAVRIDLENGTIICASGDPILGDPGIIGRETEED